MKILKSVFAVLFVATLFTSCAEEEYIRPRGEEITSPTSEDSPRNSIPIPPPQD